MLLNTSNRDSRPHETMFTEWETDATKLCPKLVEMMGEMGVEMTELDVYKYLAWSAECAVARIFWAIGDEVPKVTAIMGTLADDVTRRYVAARKGAFEAPDGWPMFDSLQEFEDGLTEHVGDKAKKAPLVSGGPEYASGGYL